MVNKTLIFLTLAVVIGLLGFTVLMGTIALVAKIVCILLLVLLVVSTLSNGVQGKLP